MNSNPLSRQDLFDLKEKACEIVKKVGEFVYSSRENKGTIHYKNGRDMVTSIDVQAEKMLTEELSKLLPDAGLILEEGESTDSKEFNWVIDPIDQTKNYVGNIPLYFIQIALVNIGAPIVSVVYNPVSNQLFSSSKGSGVFLNGEKLTPSPQTELKNCIVDFEFGGRDDVEWKLKYLNLIAKKAYRIRITAATFSLGLLTGGVDACLLLNQSAKIMDTMPRLGLFLETKLDIRKYKDNSKEFIVCAAPSVQEEISSLFGFSEFVNL
jgi:fructose-1,6-bisphosphatase/inositol monophosphatase family enzyme